ncbi:hypothetical protein A8L34_27960 [Bacillus sp. FJAT-27264]|uniref:SAF domain-containing protein n=1 Tax=Paenibacillus sp. (strain DSM 101736 / FJAT-27264) TaxID=1850362 RepID=UPI000807EDB3|nr:SAF domain-containing protein [Bacillus sp. FJAT-27264]OBZ15884.1 hypothetical protein A8L34_27960 [Bacillus sp. FJAT-27264]
MSWFSNLLATMPRKFKVAFVILGIVLVVGGQAAVMTIYMDHLQEKVSTIEVVRAKMDLEAHKILTEEDLEVKNIKVEDVVGDFVSDMETLIGTELLTTMKAREQFTPQKVGLASKKPGQFTVEIPSSWVLSYPQSLRNFDTIAFWDVLDTSKINSANNALYQAFLQSQNQSKTDGNPTTTQEPTPAATPVAELKKSDPFLEGVIVAFFKDATSNEVQDVSTNQTPRISSTAVGTKIEVNLTPKQFGELRAKAEAGYKFIIGYK